MEVERGKSELVVMSAGWARVVCALSRAVMSSPGEEDCREGVRGLGGEDVGEFSGIVW